MIELHFLIFKICFPNPVQYLHRKVYFPKCNAPFPSATVMSQLGVQSRPVHILTFFDFVMASQCFEADFHTAPKTKKFFSIG